MKMFLVNLFPAFIVRLFARPYVSGDSIEKGIKKADELWEKGIHSTLDLLGEAVDNREDVQMNVDTYLTLIDKLESREFATISLKPTALGIHDSEEYCVENLATILAAAKKKNIGITLDMEDSPYTDVTLRMFKKLYPDNPEYGTVLQSRLFRTEKDIAELKGYSGRIRICIGIYNEPADIALTKKPEMKEKLKDFTKMLIDNGHYVGVATQDERTIGEVIEMAKEYGWTSENLEFQQLLGVPVQTSEKLVMDAGFKIRKYVPFAIDWKYATPYLRRRLANNPKMAIYVLRHLFQKAS